MNERIQELIEQSNLNVIQTKGMDNIVDGCYIVSHDKIKKFAELIVQECVGIVSKRKNQAIDDGWNVDEAMTMAEMDLGEHFGVEE